MKKLLFILSSLLSTLLLGDELAWVNEQIEAIKPPRLGVTQNRLDSIETPFIFTQVKKDTKNSVVKKQSVVKLESVSHTKFTTHYSKQTYQKLFLLGAIINKFAMINGKWYKVGSTIKGYKIRKISYNSVLLVRDRKRLLLSTKSRGKTIRFQK